VAWLLSSSAAHASSTTPGDLAAILGDSSQLQLTHVLPTTTAQPVAGQERQGLLRGGAGLPVLQPVANATSPLVTITSIVGHPGGATAQTATVPAATRTRS